MVRRLVKCLYGHLILISHDRDFLDAITNRILHIENQELTLYSGNYSTFETTLIAERLAQQQQAYENSSKHGHIFKNILTVLKSKPLKHVRHKAELNNWNGCSCLRLHISIPIYL